MFKEILNELQILISRTDWFKNRVEDEIATRKAQEGKAQVDRIMAAIRQTSDPLELNSHKPYVLGKMDPLERRYTSFSGVDARITFSDDPALVWPRQGAISYGVGQAVSWEVHWGGVPGETWDVQGTIVELLIDMPRVPEGRYMNVVAANEYGKTCVLLQVEDFEVLTTSGGISIDDIVTEQQHTWRGKLVQPIPGLLDGNRQEEAQNACP